MRHGQRPGNSVSITNASLPPGVGNHLTLTIDGIVSPDTTGDLVNMATVIAAAGAIDTAPANNTATDIDTQGAGVADLLVSKTDGTAVYTPGVPITYQIVVVNDGPSHAVGFAIDDVVPAAITGVGASCVVTSGDGTCGTNDTAGNTIAFSGVDLAAASTLTVTVTGTIDPAATGDLSNTATVTVPGGAGFTDPDPTSNAATDIDTLGSQLVDLAIPKDDGQTSYVAGTPISYTVTVTNAGPSTATDVSLSRRATGRDHQPEGDLRRRRAAPTAAAGAPCAARWKRGCQPAAGRHADDRHRRRDRPGCNGDLVNTATMGAGSGATNGSGEQRRHRYRYAGNPPVTSPSRRTTARRPMCPARRSASRTVTNAGPSTANGVNLVDTVPADNHRRGGELRRDGDGQLRNERLGRQQHQFHQREPRARRGQRAHADGQRR